jgi:hypothetical protein
MADLTEDEIDRIAAAHWADGKLRRVFDQAKKYARERQAPGCPVHWIPFDTCAACVRDESDEPAP